MRGKTSNINSLCVKEEKKLEVQLPKLMLLDFKKQEEYGPKKFIKP